MVFWDVAWYKGTDASEKPAAFFFTVEWLGTIYQNTQRHSPEDRKLPIHSRENFTF
jgi:hypothetical protein